LPAPRRPLGRRRAAVPAGAPRGGRGDPRSGHARAGWSQSGGNPPPVL
ncbi:MAG: L-fuco-beta-pyranose dehydrogenase, partial [uncultured Thermomicrobiales bacterium]